MTNSTPFDIMELRRIIFGFLYPPIIKKGMIVSVVQSAFHPFLTNRTGPIHKISKFKRLK